MSTKRPNDSDEDDSFFDDDLFDNDLFENDDDSVVVQRPMHRGPQFEDDDDDSLFDALLGESGVGSDISVSAPRLAQQDLFEEDHTEVIMDEDVVLPNTYFTDEKGKVFHVRRTPFLIGRSKECDLLINVKGVSRKHAELTFGAGNFVIRDLDSLNGTRVNGTPVPQIRLNDADVVQLGRHTFNFFTDTSPATKGPGTRHSNTKSSSMKSSRSKGPQSNAARRNAQQTNPVGRPLPSRDHEEEPEYINSRQNTSDLLVKVNFVIVAFIILVTLTYVIWEDLSGDDEEQLPVIQNPSTNALQFPELPSDKDLLSLDGDWTQTGTLPPLESDLEQMAKAVEAQMKGEKPPVTDRQNPVQSESEKRIEEDVIAIRKLEAQERDRQAKRAAEDAEDELERRSVRESNEAQSLLASVRSSYMSGNKLSSTLARMKSLSRSNALNGRMRRELGNTHDVYKSLSNQFNKGDKLYEAGKTDLAFQAWQQLLTQEKSVVGSEKSYFGGQISDRVIEMTVEKARLADADGDFAQALKLYQKLVQLRPEGPYKSKIEQLLASAEEKFTQAEKVMSSDPGQAVRMLQSVMDATPRDHPLHIRAESKLVWLKEGL